MYPSKSVIGASGIAVAFVATALLYPALANAQSRPHSINYSASKSNSGNIVISNGTNCTAFVVQTDVDGIVTGSTSATNPCPIANGEYFLPPPQTPVLTIPHIVDGGSGEAGTWQTRLVLTNTTASAASASVTFYQDTAAGDGTTQPWALSFLEAASAQNLALAPGSTTFLTTPGTNPTLTEGFGEATVSDGVQVYALFTWSATNGGQGTAPGTIVGNDYLLPFDNTRSNLSAVALANPAQTAETISVSIKTADGTVSQSSLNMPASGHKAVIMSTQFPKTANTSGLAEFSSSTGTFSLIALQFNPQLSFTTAQTYPVDNGPIIGAPDPLVCVLNPLGSGCPNPAFLLLTLDATVGSGSTAAPVQITIMPDVAGGYDAAVSGTINGQAVSGSFVGGTLTSPAPNTTTFFFSAVSPQSTFTGGALGFVLTETAFDAAVGEATGTVAGQMTLIQTGVGGGVIAGSWKMIPLRIVREVD